MDEVEQQRRWETAQELYQAATTTLSQQQYRACAGLAYQLSAEDHGHEPVGECQN